MQNPDAWAAAAQRQHRDQALAATTQRDTAESLVLLREAVLRLAQQAVREAQTSALTSRLTKLGPDDDVEAYLEMPVSGHSEKTRCFNQRWSVATRPQTLTPGGQRERWWMAYTTDIHQPEPESIPCVTPINAMENTCGRRSGGLVDITDFPQWPREDPHARTTRADMARIPGTASPTGVNSLARD
ncbi:unnamed protein product [Boreogadus saida]